MILVKGLFITWLLQSEMYYFRVTYHGFRMPSKMSLFDVSSYQKV